MKEEEKYQRKFLKLKLRDLKREASAPVPEKKNTSERNRNRAKVYNNGPKKDIQKEIKQLEAKLHNYASSEKASSLKTKRKKVTKDRIKRPKNSVNQPRITRRNAKTNPSPVEKKYQKIEVAWKNAIFDDGFIKIRLESRRFVNYPYHHSRSAFEMIKPLIIRKDIEPLTVEVIGSRIYSIENLSLLSDVMQYLKIQKEWNLFRTENSGNASNIIDALSKMSAKAFNLFYKNKDLTPYLKVLCELQSETHRVIPVMEECNGKFSSVNAKDSFLFTTVKNTDMYIIWESTEERKATYIFKSSIKDYEKERQKIFDYISTAHDYKRTNLRLGITDKNESIKAHATLNHTGIEKWKERLKEKTGLIKQV
ncbi:hypothetical protein [Parapedobacter tibetensis]|uniref:hypothetical protein n=1 Tax=Parapedobacter tibetensis TaxID=2972951 RepID=UPI00214D5C4F|nr:hypothetical protein [Parapedobacter tibetensis]